MEEHTGGRTRRGEESDERKVGRERWRGKEER